MGKGMGIRVRARVRVRVRVRIRVIPFSEGYFGSIRQDKTRQDKTRQHWPLILYTSP
jgi:hypothetical protein